LVKDYNYGEIARAGIERPQAYAFRNRYALPAVAWFSFALQARLTPDSHRMNDQAACQASEFSAPRPSRRADNSTLSTNRKLK
jgi:hypothetical protein